MREDIEILKFEETHELKFVGIATIRLYRQIVLCYKVCDNKDHTGFFIVPPSYKRETNGQEKWKQWFMLDSRIFAEEVEDMIRDYVYKYFNQQKNVNNEPQKSQEIPINQTFNNPKQEDILPF